MSRGNIGGMHWGDLGRYLVNVVLIVSVCILRSLFSGERFPIGGGALLIVYSADDEGRQRASCPLHSPTPSNNNSDTLFINKNLFILGKRGAG